MEFQLTFPLQAWIAGLSLLFTALLMVLLALALYVLTPENYLTIRQALPGAIFFALGWIVATKLFQLYVARYDRYNPTYLALASIIVLLTWMHLILPAAVIRRQIERHPPTRTRANARSRASSARLCSDKLKLRTLKRLQKEVIDPHEFCNFFNKSLL